MFRLIAIVIYINLWTCQILRYKVMDNGRKFTFINRFLKCNHSKGWNQIKNVCTVVNYFALRSPKSYCKLSKIFRVNKWYWNYPRRITLNRTFLNIRKYFHPYKRQKYLAKDVMFVLQPILTWSVFLSSTFWRALFWL